MASEMTNEQLVAEEACKSRIPVLPRERTLGFRDMVMIQISFSVATWMLVTGAYIGFSAPFWPALIISVFGVSVPLVWHCFIGKMTTRWGIDGSILARATWGPIGAAVLLPFFLFLTYIAWTSIPVVMFGRTAHEALSYVGGGGFFTDARLWGVVAFCLSALVLWKGATVLYWFFRFVTPTIVGILIILTVRTIVHYGWGHLVNIVPEGFDPDPDMSFMIGSEIAIGLGFSWVFCFSVYGRLAKTEPTGFYATWLGWGPAWGLLCVPAILAALAAGVTDPVYLLEGAHGVWVGLYICFLFFANVFSAVCTMYIVSLAARTLWPRIPWIAAVLINLPVIVLVFWSGAYDEYGKFIALVGATMGPLGGVMVVDYMLKRFKLNLREVYSQKKGSGYWYHWGVNWPAFIAFGIGAWFALWMYNPLTAVVAHPGIFKFAGAAIPATAMASAIYLGLAVLVLVPKKIGFPDVRASVRRTQPEPAAPECAPELAPSTDDLPV